MERRTMADNLQIQFRLRARVAREKKIIDMIREAGNHSGVPKLLMLAGYEALYGNRLQGINIKAKSPEIEAELAAGYKEYREKREASSKKLAIKYTAKG